MDTQVVPAQLVHQAKMDTQVAQEAQVPLVLKDQQVNQVAQEDQVNQAKMDTQVVPVHKDLKVAQDPLEIQVEIYYCYQSNLFLRIGILTNDFMS